MEFTDREQDHIRELMGTVTPEEMDGLLEAAAPQFAHLPEPERTERLHTAVGHMIGDGSVLRAIKQQREEGSGGRESAG